MKIKAILEKELYTTPPLMPVVVAKINGTKNDIPRAFRITNESVPTFDIKHLRRIKSLDNGDLECIICRLKCNDKDDQALDIEIKELQSKFATENIFTDYRVALVPSKAPKTNHQLRACSDIWPCKFAKSNYLISCIEGSLINESERIVLKIIVNKVIEYVKAGTNNQPLRPESAAVVFRCAKIHGVGLSSSQVLRGNPIQHSTMSSIDAVASNAGGGQWKTDKQTKHSSLHESIQSELDKHEDLEGRLDVNFLPYLCTNYDIFVTEEPCLMCTMGLVQSRIRRLFFLDKESCQMAGCKAVCYPDRAIQDFLVHRDRNLNHRFEAWRISLVP